jgi:phosphatidylglycerol---prolipoprotein diacylglyceryl transferase
MYPVLIKIGPLTIHTYGLLTASGFLIALWLAVRQAGRERIQHEKIIDLGFYSLIAAIAGSRIFYVLTNLSYFIANPIDIIKIWEGGLVFYGGVMFALPFAVWYARRKGLPIWQTADIWAPSIAIGHAIGRIGCFCAGCCYGKPAEDIPWAVIFNDADTLAVKGVPLHPSQLYESAGEFLSFLILIIIRRHQSFKGQLFWIYVLNYSVIRSVVEIFRGDEIRGFIFGSFSISQGISVLMFISALTAIVVLKKKS